jgi:hypothetical protein
MANSYRVCHFAFFCALSGPAAESFPLFQSFRLDRNPSSKKSQTSWNEMIRIRSGITNRTKIFNSKSQFRETLLTNFIRTL